MNGDPTYDKWPLVLNTDPSYEYEFLRPNNEGKIKILTGTSIIVACPESTIDNFTVSYNEFECAGNNRFTSAGSTYNFYDLKCRSVSFI